MIPPTNRREFLRKVAISSTSMALAAHFPTAAQTARDLTAPIGKTMKVFQFDLNWVLLQKPKQEFFPASAEDWAFINPQEYFDYHKNFGVNIMFLQAYNFAGYAYYPTKFGPIAPGPGGNLFPEVYRLCQKDHMPVHAYFCVGTDLIVSNHRDAWVVPTSKNEYGHWGYLAPESPWTDLLCARIDEFLRRFPVEWIMFDWFGYGNIEINGLPVQPAWFVKEPFKEIVGREMPEKAADITPEESLKYKREILARQYYRIRETVHKASRETKIYFNVPFRVPAPDLWVNHPLLNESDMLFAELQDCDGVDVTDWLLKIRKPHQRVMTSLNCAPQNWKKWYDKGCDFFATTQGTPPDFIPDPAQADRLKIISAAFKEMV